MMAGSEHWRTFGHVFLASCQPQQSGSGSNNATKFCYAHSVAFLASWSRAYLCALAAKYGAENICLYCQLFILRVLVFFSILYIFLFVAYLLHK